MAELQALFNQMKIEMSNQTKEIISQIDQKLVPFTQEIEKLKLENECLKEKVAYLEKNNRANNIIIYGLKETEQSTTDLLEVTTEKIKTDLNICLEDRDINAVRRIGKKDSKNEKARPVMISFVNEWKKNDIMRQKKKLKDINIAEDFPKEVLVKRKELQEQLVEERKKGNFAIIKYDKLIIKEGGRGIDKRKRTSSTSPEATVQPRKQHLTSQTSKTNRTNAFDIMRGRSSPFSSSSKPPLDPKYSKQPSATKTGNQKNQN